MVEYTKYDGGYGSIGNMVHYLLLKDLTGEEDKQYRDNLKKENKEAYNEYLTYEKLMNKQFNKIENG